MRQQRLSPGSSDSHRPSFSTTIRGIIFSHPYSSAQQSCGRSVWGSMSACLATVRGTCLAAETNQTSKRDEQLALTRAGHYLWSCHPLGQVMMEAHVLWAAPAPSRTSAESKGRRPNCSWLLPPCSTILMATRLHGRTAIIVPSWEQLQSTNTQTHNHKRRILVMPDTTVHPI